MRVLVVEDEKNLAESLVKLLEGQKYQAEAVHDGVSGLDYALTGQYDAVILDVMLPGLNGFQVAAALRKKGSAIPILMLTARDELADKVRGLDSGADDYLTKPFDLPELEIRLETLVARAGGRRRSRTLQVADLMLDMETLEATRQGQVLHLYPACRKLLEVLMQASPGAVARARLEFALWGDSPPDGDMLRSHIYELRRSVDGPFDVKLIQTLPKTGYRIAAPNVGPGDGDGG